jgi:hypothetical protein
MKDEALKLALEALEDLQRQYGIYPNSFWDWSKGRKAITAIKQALAAPTSAEYAMGYAEGFNDGCKPAPVQQPVAWMHWLNGPCRVLMDKDEAMMELDRLNREYPVASHARKMRPLVFGDTTPPAAQRQWVNPNEKSQKQFLPHIGEPVLFCHDGVTYFGKHTGGSFTTGQGITTRNFNTWECHWMYPQSAKLKEKNND